MYCSEHPSLYQLWQTNLTYRPDAGPPPQLGAVQSESDDRRTFISTGTPASANTLGSGNDPVATRLQGPDGRLAISTLKDFEPLKKGRQMV